MRNEVVMKIILFGIVSILIIVLAIALVNNFLNENRMKENLSESNNSIISSQISSIQNLLSIYIMQKENETNSVITIVKGKDAKKLKTGEKVEIGKDAYIKHGKDRNGNTTTLLTLDLIKASGYNTNKYTVDENKKVDIIK